jgi:hypothetical protein
MSVWPLGVKSEGNASPYNLNYTLDFTSLPPKVELLPDFENIFAYYSVYSEPATGQLRFFSNGMRIIDQHGDIVPNCDSINYGELWIQYNAGPGDHPTLTNGYFIPMSSDTMWFIHQQIEKPINAESPGIDYTQYTLMVDKGQGFECVLKDQKIRTGAMLPLDVVRHGNGKDWWMIVPEWGSSLFSKYILSAEGISWHDDQYIGYPLSSHQEDAGGLNTFSKDGTKYAYHNNFIGNQVFDFDRCTGLFSNPIHIPLQENYNPGARNTFSPNGRFLYVPTFSSIIQYDLQSENVVNSGDTVAVWDQHVCLPDWPFGNGFFSVTLGLDDKIYISAWSSNNCLSVINRPNLRGIACDVRQHGIILPGTLNLGLPGYIDYQLGPLQGSPCDPEGGCVMNCFSHNQ